MREIDEAELKAIVSKANGHEAVLFYTPLCGTCKIAERMLGIVEATSASIPMYKVNINYTPEVRDAWKIASVPCLVVLKDGQPLRKEYAMQSVDYLYEIMKGLD
ncbi:thioredoxin family protein [Paenibacillus mendelii]|uniref:Thioredoxin family protein n=1 Tax=Paenibacillus mendelii TaxID=206163 RepID=A0ABV6J1X7_9BACL|nr:thioredoxin family protein [Paenibacillus mendelii]MCQ6563170.1 thioredoxin family protein [Paenibacillus mendelii]